MTNLRQLLAHNMKERRQILKMSQYRLAQKAGTSTYYIGMIETLKKYPSPEMMQRIASGLGIDTPELFSMTSSYPSGIIKRYQKDVLKLIKESVESILERKLVQLDNRKKILCFKKREMTVRFGRSLLSISQ